MGIEVWENNRIGGSEELHVHTKSIQSILDTVAPMNTNQPRRQVPKIQFRVLIIGRANAGKTTILQRVCDTTESPNIYRVRGDKKEEVRHGGLAVLPVLVS